MKKLILYIMQSLGIEANVEVVKSQNKTTFVLKVPNKAFVEGKVFQSIKTILHAVASQPIGLKLEEMN